MKFFLFFIVIFCSIVSGCCVDLESVFIENISEVQREVCTGKYGDISAILITGERESEYIKNGYSTEKISFAILTIRSEDNKPLEECEYTLICDDKSYSGNFISNPYGGLIVDIGSVELGRVMVLTVSFEETVIDIVLRPITDDIISCDEVVGIVTNLYRGELRGLVRKKSFEGEVYIKLLGNIESGGSDLCWGVTVITRKGSRWNYVISAYTGEVLSKQICE